MVKLSLTGSLAVAVICAACGGSPTSPTFDRASTKGTDVAGAPTPAPSPVDPIPPAPAPPAPPAPAPGTPVPTPAPAPPGDPAETWHATVDVQRASPGSALPPTFTVTVHGDQMRFGSLEVTILARDGHHIYARKGQELTIQIDDDKWTVTSVEVFATGTISYTEP